MCNPYDYGLSLSQPNHSDLATRQRHKNLGTADKGAKRTLDSFHSP